MGYFMISSSAFVTYTTRSGGGIASVRGIDAMKAKPTTTSKKPQVKLQDLKPKKDAKGGRKAGGTQQGP